jgi:hypothetical protein
MTWRTIVRRITVREQLSVEQLHANNCPDCKPVCWQLIFTLLLLVLFYCSVSLREIKAWMSTINLKLANNRLRDVYQVGAIFNCL